MNPKPVSKNTLPTQIIKKINIKQSQIEMYINIDLGLIIETISEMKHTLHPSFLLPFIIILRAKIAVCPQGNWKSCFCCGCMLARRINTLISKSQELSLSIVKETAGLQGLNQIFKSSNTFFDLYLNKDQTLLSKLKQSERIKVCENQIKVFSKLCSSKVKQWQINEELNRFYCIFCVVRNIIKIAGSNLQEHILVLLQKIKMAKQIQSTIKLVIQFRILFEETN